MHDIEKKVFACKLQLNEEDFTVVLLDKSRLLKANNDRSTTDNKATILLNSCSWLDHVGTVKRDTISNF